MSGYLGVTPEERHRMIAETAYFLAQERGFTGGDPVSDWIEAERRVDRQLFAAATARLVERLESGVATVAKNLVRQAPCLDARGERAHRVGRRCRKARCTEGLAAKQARRAERA